MKLHLLVGVFALLFVVGAAGYVTFGPQPEPAPIQYPGEPATGELIKTSTGVKYYEMQMGTGREIPNDSCTVRVKYAGYLMNGTKFDSNDSMSFGLNQVIKGWPDGMKGMKVGGKRKLIIPPERGYQYQNHNKIPAGSTLVFDVELLEIESDEPKNPMLIQ